RAGRRLGADRQETAPDRLNLRWVRRQARHPTQLHTRGRHSLTATALPPSHPKRPWQCLYFLPLPQGHSSLRPTLPQLAGFFGSRLTAAAAFDCGTKVAPAKAISSSPVLGSNLCASITGSGGACSSCGIISTRINCAVTASRRCAIMDSNRL